MVIEGTSSMATEPTSPPEMHSLSRRAHWAAGQPISYLMHKALAHPQLISLAAGFVDQATLPTDEVESSLSQLFSDPAAARAALQYGTTQGHPPLREILLERLRQADGGPESLATASPDEVIVTAGSNQLLHLLADTLLDPGDIVLVAAPTYFVFLGTLNNVGARAVSVEADGRGMIPESLQERLEALRQSGEVGRVKAIYVMSYFDNPTSVSMTAERRAEVVEIVKTWSTDHPIYVIEDAAYRELRYRGDDEASIRSYDDDSSHVIFVHTFSKSFSPGLRVGFGLLPPALVEPVFNQKGNLDFGSPNLNQHLLTKALETGLVDDHIAILQDSYRIKLDAMLAAADEHLKPIDGVEWRKTDGGLYVWLELPPHVDAGPDGPLFDTGIEEGMLYVPGQYCFPADAGARRNTIRLSYGVQTVEGIHAGIAALARALKRVM